MLLTNTLAGKKSEKTDKSSGKYDGFEKFRKLAINIVKANIFIMSKNGEVKVR